MSWANVDTDIWKNEGDIIYSKTILLLYFQNVLESDRQKKWTNIGSTKGYVLLISLKHSTSNFIIITDGLRVNFPIVCKIE